MPSMRSCVHQRHRAVGWEVARPNWTSRVPGVTMAGFDAALPPTGNVRVVPHPAVMMILVFGDGLPVLADSAGRRPRRGSLVAGLGFGFGGSVSFAGGNVECVQVRLSPVVARAILGVSPAELDGTIVALDNLWGWDTPRLSDQLAEKTSWQERFELVDGLLARRYAAAAAVDPEVAWAWEQIIASRGGARVTRLATDIGWTRKRLWSRFREQIGLPPKLAAKLIRFDHAAHRLVAGHAAARVAAAAGYADQSHLHRDVVAFAGVTPTAVAGEPFLLVDDVAWASY
ncbi:MAG: helix-turn-helix domain-containing protein [Stackebrandtia sp.]